MLRKIRFKKQYKPIGFGDRPDPGTVEGHRNAMREAADTRDFNRRTKELNENRQVQRTGLMSRLRRFLGVGNSD